MDHFVTVMDALKNVSMKSGLEDRNNDRLRLPGSVQTLHVSMKSGLEDRNNPRLPDKRRNSHTTGLNEVRPGRPEQLGRVRVPQARDQAVSQ